MKSAFAASVVVISCSYAWRGSESHSRRKNYHKDIISRILAVVNRLCKILLKGKVKDILPRKLTKTYEKDRTEPKSPSSGRGGLRLFLSQDVVGCGLFSNLPPAFGAPLPQAEGELQKRSSVGTATCRPHNKYPQNK